MAEANELKPPPTPLSINQLFILSLIETGDASILGASPLSPLGLLVMATMASLKSQGLLKRNYQGRRWELSPKGEAVVRWWREGLAHIAPALESKPARA